MREQRRKVLHLIGSNFVGGPEKQILSHAALARAQGWDVVVGSFHDTNSQAEILTVAQRMGLETLEVSNAGHFVPGAVQELRELVRQHGVDVVCTHGYRSNVIGYFAKKRLTQPHIAFVRGWTGETRRIRCYEMLDRFLLARSPHVVCVSRPQAEYIGKRMSPCLEHPRVIHNAVHIPIATAPVNKNRLRTELGLKPDVRLIGAAGRLSREKGHHLLIEAVSRLRRRIGDLQLVILGEGRELERLQTQCQELGVADAVTFAGFRKQIAPWIRACDVVVNPSLTEGMPNVVLETMALGTAVVATAVGGVPDMIRHRQNGLLVPAGDSSALADAIESVLAEPEFARQMAAEAQRGLRQWSAETQTEKLISLYCEVLGECPEPAGQAKQQREQLPYVSVVMPVLNESAHLPHVLSDLLQQDYDPARYEIIVVDGGSTDDTVRIAEDFQSTHAEPRITVIHNPGRRSSSGRNLGLRHSRGELIVFVDGHCRVPDGLLLKSTVDVFTRTGADCLCRPQPLQASVNTSLQRVVADVRATVFGHGRDSTIYQESFEGIVDPTSSGASYRRTVFDKIGMYDEAFDACEDVEFNYRVHRSGLKSYFSSRVKVLYEPRNSISGLWRQMVRYGRGRSRFLRKHPEAFTVAQVLPAAFLAMLVIGVLVAPFSAVVRLGLAAVIGLWSACAIAFSAALTCRKGIAHLYLGPLVYATVHLGLGAGFWVETLASIVTSPVKHTSAVVLPGNKTQV